VAPSGDVLTVGAVTTTTFGVPPVGYHTYAVAAGFEALTGACTPPPGYWMLGEDGAVYAFGAAANYGDARSQVGTAHAVDLEPTPSGLGYWIVDDLGRVFAFGDAPPLTNLSSSHPPVTLSAGEHVTSLAASRVTLGLWIFTDRGRAFAFGNVSVIGDLSGLTLNGPVLDSISTPSGAGYYMVASDGGIFAFGDAAFHGSMGGQPLNAPVHSLVPDPDGAGYWLVASDGGVFAFDAGFRGSVPGVLGPGQTLNKPIVGMVPNGDGYLMVASDGGVFNFSNQPFLGSLGDHPPTSPVVAAAVFPALRS
jgi:hypothetical protein